MGNRKYVIAKPFEWVQLLFLNEIVIFVLSWLFKQKINTPRQMVILT